MSSDLVSSAQKTLKAPIHCRGVGLHSGAHVEMTLFPAAPNTGIRFRRSDMNGVEIEASWRNVVESTLCTTLSNGKGVSIATVEHLMAAFAGLEVDNAVVEVDGPEVPIMDGSAEPFVAAIDQAGIAVLPATRRCIQVLKPVRVDGKPSTVQASPVLGEHTDSVLHDWLGLSADDVGALRGKGALG